MTTNKFLGRVLHLCSKNDHPLGYRYVKYSQSFLMQVLSGPHFRLSYVSLEVEHKELAQNKLPSFGFLNMNLCSHVLMHCPGFLWRICITAWESISIFSKTVFEDIVIMSEHQKILQKVSSGREVQTCFGSLWCKLTRTALF